MSENKEIRYELLRPAQIVAIRERMPVAYLPFGPLEWHAPHLPLGTDMLHPYAVALEACKLSRGVVLPPLPLGTETILEPARLLHRGFKGDEKICGMDFPSFMLPSLYVEDSAFGVIMHEMIRALKRQQWKVIMLVNGHGGQNHVRTLMRIASEENEPGQIAVRLTYAFDLNPNKGGHAERYETSDMMAYFPDSVDLSALPPLPEPLHNLEFGVLDALTCAGRPTPDRTVRPEQDPRTATREEGVATVANTAQRIANEARQALAAVS